LRTSSRDVYVFIHERKTFDFK